MFFGTLIVRNVVTRKLRSGLTAFAVAISIMTVVTMGVLTDSLRLSAISVLRTGTADFTIAQKDVQDVLYSSIDDKEMERIRARPDVESVVGVLIHPFKLDDDHPFFLEIGIQPSGLQPFGVHIVAGQPYGATATDEIMLGYRAASDLDKQVGDRITLETVEYKVVGIFSTGEVFGDSAAMLPLVTLQANERKPSTVTLGFVRAKEGADIPALRQAIEEAAPQLATVKTEADFGRIDRNLDLISAANTGVSALALVIGAVTILNMMVLSVFERTREFGVLRAIGWSRFRVLAEVLGEAGLVTLSGAAAGVGLGFLSVRLLERSDALRGVFNPVYTTDVFVRALLIAFGMALFGALYPALRTAFLRPLTAIRHE